jgi:thiol-disulfide isomerase/thioredoxin
MERKKIISLLSLLFFITNVFAQIDSIGVEKITKMELKVDSETKFYDENNKEIKEEVFKIAHESGKFSLKPVLGAHNKVISLTLVSTAPSLPDFSEAKSFTGIDIKGKELSLTQLKGKVVVVNFWFTACAPCIQEIPELNDLVETFKNNADVVFLAPTFDNATRINTFIEKNTFAYNIIPNAIKWIADYQISNFPTHLVIDKQGTLAFSQINTGKKEAAELKKTIELLLLKDAKRIVTAQATKDTATKTNDTDEPINGFFMMTNKTVIIDEEGKELDHKVAGELLNTQEFIPYKRKTKEGEIIIIKKKKS